MSEGGFEAVRHRSVARRAGLPLASTTYYFSSLDDLIARAVEHIGMIEVAQLRARVAALSRRRRGPETTAEVLVDLLVGDVSGPGLAEQLISRYERHIACTRLPALQESMRRSLRQRAEAVAEAVERSGRTVRIELVCTLICAVDGSVVSALVEGRDPRASALGTVVDLIDVLAPIDHRPVRIGMDPDLESGQRQRRRHDVAGGEVPVDRHARRAALGVQRHVGTDHGVDRILGAAQLALALRGHDLPAQLDPVGTGSQPATCNGTAARARPSRPSISSTSSDLSWSMLRPGLALYFSVRGSRNSATVAGCGIDLDGAPRRR